MGQPGPIWGILIGSHAHWAKPQTNPEHLLYLAPLYTKLIVILDSKPKMGLLGAIGFSLAFVSLIQVNAIFPIKMKMQNLYKSVLKQLYLI